VLGRLGGRIAGFESHGPDFGTVVVVRCPAPSDKVSAKDTSEVQFFTDEAENAGLFEKGVYDCGVTTFECHENWRRP